LHPGRHQYQQGPACRRLTGQLDSTISLQNAKVR
jgi:hypothetical protein